MGIRGTERIAIASGEIKHLGLKIFFWDVVSFQFLFHYFFFFTVMYVKLKVMEGFMAN